MESIIERKEIAIHEYFNMWLTNDFEHLEDLMTIDCTYQDSSGKCFLSLAEIEKWIEEKKQKRRILSWDVKKIWPTMDNTFFVLWNFTSVEKTACNFDGISIIQFDRQGMITSIREYKSNSEHEFPYHY